MESRRSFLGRYRECLKEYSNKTCVPGCRYSVEEGRSTWERLLWTLLLLGTIMATIWLLLSSYVSFSEAPTATGRSVNRVPINTIPFPAVAICTGTRISREALKNYTDFIFSVQNRTTAKIADTYEGVYNHLLQLGSFYTLTIDQDNFYLYDRLHSFFMEYYGNPYPLREIIANVSPSCDSLIYQCFWNGEEENCSKIFQENRTDYGVCCTFNYQRLPGAVMAEISAKGLSVPSDVPLYVKDSEFREGLRVVIEQNSSDQIYNIQSSMASRVLIFHPQDYPDMSTNAYIERQIYLSGELFLELYPESIKGSDTMRHVSAKKRGCFFREEKMLSFKGFYSFSECILACKLRDMIHSCGCYPHQYPNIYNRTRCLLNDISCLIKWKTKWDNFEPHTIENVKKSNIETQCEMCMPTCNYIKYGTRTNFGMLNSLTLRDILRLTKTSKTRFFSVVHVNFALPYAVEYHQTIVSTWYDLLATLGGLAGFTIGASLLSVMEFLWFSSGKIGCVWLGKCPEEVCKELPQIYLTDFKIARKQFSYQEVMKNK